jgi:hypothetical protein
MTIKTQEEHIGTVIDVMCAVIDGDIPALARLLENGYPLDVPYRPGLATQSLLDFSAKHALPATHRFLSDFHAKKAPVKSSHYLPSGLWRQAVRQIPQKQATTPSFRNQ